MTSVIVELRLSRVNRCWGCRRHRSSW